MVDKDPEGNAQDDVANAGQGDEVADDEDPWSRPYYMRLCVGYFLLFAAAGMTFPFMPVFFFSYAQLSKPQIGIVFAMQRVVGSVMTPVMGHLADYNHRHRFVLVSCVLITGGTNALLYSAAGIADNASRYTMVLIVAFIVAFFSTSTPIADSFAVAYMGTTTLYGKVRLWGAVGFGVVSLTGGMMVENSSWASMFLGYIVLQVLASLLWGSMDFSMMHGTEDESAVAASESEFEMVLENESKEGPAEDAAEVGICGDSKAVGESDPCASDSTALEADRKGKKDVPWAVICKPENLMFFFMITVGGALSGVVDTFLFVWLSELGGGETCMGAARLIMCAAEVPFFQASGKILERLGTYGTLSLVGGAYTVRFVYYSLLTNPWVVLPAEVLHGITFAALWSAAVTHGQEIAPPGQAAFIQGLNESLHWGLGYGFGAFVGGFAYEELGAVPMFLVSAAVSVIMMVVCALQEKMERRDRAQTDPALSGVAHNEPWSRAESESRALVSDVPAGSRGSEARA